ncbi:VWA domain-containing protein [Marivita sp. S0852]|uniref:VWA domain-containing protein n=1 Tax=Marivita sp. S0852 TaxID=3373893 RepID=UPI0039827CAA
MRLPLALSFTAFATIAMAQDQPNTVLVMDGSGSMWGQVDGVAKITIAQDVVGTLLSDFPVEQGLGLTVYGHRERGECTDIETVVAPAPGTATQIAQAVNGIKPLGKTPMTDAVIAAAQALRYTEEKATVILVSDGVETCNPDPCAAARLLEEAGIDFTAHVIGFDVGSDAEALAQMQCIADETGGTFLTADTADQLIDALTEVAVATPEPEPEPILVPTTLTATLEGSDTLVSGPVLWELTDRSGVVLDETDANPLTLDLAEGSYTATAYSVALETELSRQFVAIGETAAVQIAFPEPKETARLVAPAAAVAGSTIQVGWVGPDDKGDYIGIGAAGADGADMWQNSALTSSGNPVELLVPTVTGPHVIQYFKRAERESLGGSEIQVTPVDVTLSAPASAPAGSDIIVEWTGPDYTEDYIGIGRVGANGSDQWENWTYTSAGTPAKLVVPGTPGDYEITYFLRQDRTPAQTIAFTATEISATLVAPTEAAAGSMIEVGWTGPNYPDDYIGIGRVDATGSAKWENWVQIRDGNPIDLLMPATPGEYLITYFQRQDRTPLASIPITLKPLDATVTAPATAMAGEVIEVNWTGPDYQKDYIGIGRVGAKGASRWENWTRTSEGSPLKLTMPATAGDYVITYFQQQDRTPVATVPITLQTPEASLTAPSEAIAGSTIDVGWTGPDYKDDFIGIGRVDASGAEQWETYRYTRDGSPARVTVPSSPGNYEITYFLRQDHVKLAKSPLTVTAPEAKLIAPDRAQAGSTIEIGWVGPDYKDDYIGIGLASASGGKQWEAWRYVRDGNPVEIDLPEIPGEYRIRYFMRLDRTVLAEHTLTLE